MTAAPMAIVLFGDVVDSRRDAGSAGFLRSLREELDEAYGEHALASTGFTQGDEIQLLLGTEADPFTAVLRAALRHDTRELRWAAVGGPVERGTGPATERSGAAFRAARDLLGRAKSRREGMLAVTGDPEADALLAGLAPLLPALLDDLTTRQREVARLLLVDRLRRSEVAERLRVSRATVSVIADRARVRHLERLAASLASIFADGMRRAAGAPVTGRTDGAPLGAGGSA